MQRGALARSIAMQLVGHKTASVYRQYSITPERDLIEGMEKVAAMLPNGSRVGGISAWVPSES
jgi:hypothetical protein